MIGRAAAYKALGKRMTTQYMFKTVVGATVLLTSVAALAESCPMPQGKPQHAVKPQVKQAARGVQKVTVKVDGGFSPSTITVKAGRPVQITFDVRKPGCANTILFPSLSVKKALTAGQKTIVTITPKKPGAIAFACGMGMYNGTIVAK